MPDEGTNDMRRNNADKANCSSQRHRATGCQTRANHGEYLLAPQIEANPCCCLFAES